MDPSWVEAFFFTAMQQGYAGGTGPKTKVLDMPGYKEIRYADGDFLLVDRWCVNPDSEKSAGTTTIWYQEKPVWLMGYGGVYPKVVIPFLKQALRFQYCKDGHFLGGRGPKLVTDRVAGQIYMNRPVQNDFDRFNGREEIVDMSTGAVGYHDYWGMSLL
ncbi:MAG: DUF5680 domain-containing protein [bacterium]|nr:DUF5680 domain-containing protein [bacterium]